MVRSQVLLALGLLLALAGCHKKSPNQTNQTNQPRPKPETPMSPSASYACQSNADCVLTKKRLQECCPGCRWHTVHKKRLADIVRAHDKRCRDGVKCAKRECDKPKDIPQAVCKSNRCTTIYKPRLMPGAGLIDKKGRYKIVAKLPKRYTCTTDADCVATRHRPGHCCRTGCPTSRVAGNQTWLKALLAHHKRRCGRWLKGNRHSCSYPKCYPGGRPQEKCQKGRCVVHYKRIR